MVLRFARACTLLCLMLSGALAGAQPITVTDAVGRSVTLQAPAKRIILTQARHLQVLALLHPDPVSILAGWSDEFRTSFSNEYQSYLEHFPAIAKIPVVGRHTADTFSVEQALALQPDLVLLTASFAGIGKGQDPNASLIIRQFQSAGKPVLIIHFFVQPLENHTEARP